MSIELLVELTVVRVCSLFLLIGLPIELPIELQRQRAGKCTRPGPRPDRVPGRTGLV